MTTLTLQIDNPTILGHLKEVLKSLKGVKIVDTDIHSSAEENVGDIPNSVTVEAMREARSGKDAGLVSMQDLDSFMASLL